MPSSQAVDEAGVIEYAIKPLQVKLPGTAMKCPSELPVPVSVGLHRQNRGVCVIQQLQFTLKRLLHLVLEI